MSKFLGKTFIYDIIIFLLGLVLITIAQATSNENDSPQDKCWKSNMFSVGSFCITIAAALNLILYVVFEYKLLKLK